MFRKKLAEEIFSLVKNNIKAGIKINVLPGNIIMAFIRDFFIGFEIGRASCRERV